jgi:arylsulfatase A-like enzyme
MAEGLEERGLWDEALVVVVSDHGEMFPSDGHDVGVLNNLGKPKLYGHGHALYEELLHVPLVIRPPGGLTEDREVAALTSHVDLLATVGDLLDLDLRPAAARLGEGGEKERVSLAPWLAPAPPAEPAEPAEPAGQIRIREHALAGANQIGPQQRALRHGDRKLIRYYRGDRPDELYDLAADPGERQNLAEQEPEDRERLRLRLEEAWERLGEPPVTDAARYDAETRQRLKALGYIQ